MMKDVWKYTWGSSSVATAKTVKEEKKPGKRKKSKWLVVLQYTVFSKSFATPTFPLVNYMINKTFDKKW